MEKEDQCYFAGWQEDEKADEYKSSLLNTFSRLLMGYQDLRKECKTVKKPQKRQKQHFPTVNSSSLRIHKALSPQLATRKKDKKPIEYKTKRKLHKSKLSECLSGQRLQSIPSIKERIIVPECLMIIDQNMADERQPTCQTSKASRQMSRVPCHSHFLQTNIFHFRQPIRRKIVKESKLKGNGWREGDIEFQDNNLFRY